MPTAPVQPVPPLWRELGKSASDLLLKDYPVRGISLEVKTSSNPVTFRAGGNRDTKSAAIAGDIEAKYVDSKNGIAFMQAWTTTNVSVTKVELENQIVKGFKFDLATVCDLAKGQKGGVFTATYKRPSLLTQATVDSLKGPTFTSNVVLGRDSALIGGEATYDASVGTITRYAGAIGYIAPDYAVTIHALCNLHKHFSASFYQKVSKYVEAGAKAVYDTKTTNGNVAIEFGAKVILKNDSTVKPKTGNASVKLKLNSAGMLSASYTQPFRPGVKATFGLVLDTQKLHSTSARTAVHKVGAAFVFNS
ncbi:hypothetical protein QFC22_006720 [Naganishia vaughanmartiniae]|uniref:Uncharacterized protein n=1 Tax=Naganishia vaughanmartiniae TaxID=1424756 RepID=A0ACC2WFJ2_9TREE|nr:hypothetical protein QFC22_006720 [Naganishia vaughanmartiniae]